MTRDEVLRLPRRDLARLLRAGHPIDPRALDDTEYRGIALGLPLAVELLTWKTFTKTFHRDPATGRLRGWNVRMQQTGIDGPRVPRRRGGALMTFGHYEVVARERDLLLDYGASRVRDPLVALRPDDASLLLGRSDVDLGFVRVPTPSYFLLERSGPLSHIAVPPSYTPRGREP